MNDASNNNAPLLFALDDIGLHPASRLSGISAEIPEGRTAVLGASGAGKSSLMNVLVDFEPPATGTISRPEKLFWAPQDGGLWPGVTAREHLAAMTTNAGLIEKTLESMDLSHLAGRTPNTLSRGEQARLSIARALVSDACVLLMDEPLAHVDHNRRDGFWRSICNAIVENGQSLIYSTHAPELVIGEADGLLCLSQGKLRYSGSVDQLYWNPECRETAGFLGPTNWITAEMRSIWFGGDDVPSSLRPEQLEITASSQENPNIIIESATFHGSFEEAVLRHLETGTTARFLHRPATPMASHFCNIESGVRLNYRRAPMQPLP